VSPALDVTFTARADGSVVLRATRADGSATWQVHAGAHAGFLPVHDLGHLAVETVLGTRDGFYGLLAAGWDIDDTGGKRARGPLPAEALIVEQVVGFLDRERAGGAGPFTAAELHAQLGALVQDGRLEAAPAISDAALGAVRAERESLLAAWAGTPVGTPFARRYVRPERSGLLAG
jgi:hypothetical protein